MPEITEEELREKKVKVYLDWDTALALRVYLGQTTMGFLRDEEQAAQIYAAMVAVKNGMEEHKHGG